MGKDLAELITSCRRFAQKNKFCMILAILYITAWVICSTFFRYYKTSIFRLTGLAALIAAFILITSFNPVTYDMQQYSDVYNTEDEKMQEDTEKLTNVVDVLQDDTEVTDMAEEGNITAKEVVFDKNDWNLILVNKQNKIPDDYELELVSIDGRLSCDKRIIDPLHSMFEAALEDGIQLIACSTYRNMNRQTYLFDKKIKNYVKGGESFLDSYKRAATEVTVPGTSEHEIGIAIDIYCAGYYKLDEGFEDTEAGIWLRNNSYKYGFILRYPKGKDNITGISYEPWHFRYVGEKAAKYIYDNSLTLEEFVEGI